VRAKCAVGASGALTGRMERVVRVALCAVLRCRTSQHLIQHKKSALAYVAWTGLPRHPFLRQSEKLSRCSVTMGVGFQAMQTPNIRVVLDAVDSAADKSPGEGDPWHRQHTRTKSRSLASSSPRTSQVRCSEPLSHFWPASSPAHSDPEQDHPPQRVRTPDARARDRLRAVRRPAPARHRQRPRPPPGAEGAAREGSQMVCAASPALSILGVLTHVCAPCIGLCTLTSSQSPFASTQKPRCVRGRCARSPVTR
jgi:hypothetical protein